MNFTSPHRQQHFASHSNWGKSAASLLLLTCLPVCAFAKQETIETAPSVEPVTNIQEELPHPSTTSKAKTNPSVLSNSKQAASSVPAGEFLVAYHGWANLSFVSASATEVCVLIQRFKPVSNGGVAADTWDTVFHGRFNDYHNKSIQLFPSNNVKVILKKKGLVPQVAEFGAIAGKRYRIEWDEDAESKAGSDSCKDDKCKKKDQKGNGAKEGDCKKPDCKKSDGPDDKKSCKSDGKSKCDKCPKSGCDKCKKGDGKCDKKGCKPDGAGKCDKCTKKCDPKCEKKCCKPDCEKYKKEIEQLKKEIGEIKQAAKDALTAATELPGLLKKLNQLETSLKNHKTHYQYWINKYEDAKKSLVTAQKKLTAIRNAETVFSNESTSLLEKIDYLERVNPADARLPGLRNHRAYMDKSLAEAKGKKQQAEKEVADAQKSLRTATQEKSKANKELGVAQQKYDDVKKSIDEQNKKLTNARKILGPIL